ncbi:MAG: ATP cone domain-containing protein, partial [Methanotrichaceae archaeon]
MIGSIRKRDGRIENFQPAKITVAIGKAFKAVGIEDSKAPSELAGRVIGIAEEKFPDTVPGVEDLQDIVERVLIDAGYADVAKAYILYRQRRSEIRDAKRYLGVADDLKLSVNAIEVLKKRYLQRDENGNVVETPGELFNR